MYACMNKYLPHRDFDSVQLGFSRLQNKYGSYLEFVFAFSWNYHL